MKRLLKKIHGYAHRLGFDPLTGVANVRGVPRFVSDLRTFKQANTDPALWPISELNPYLREHSDDSGVAKGHYFHQDLLVARRVHERRPVRHMDMGSRVDGFVAHVASFRPIHVFDIRVLNVSVPNIHFQQCDVTAPLPADLVGCCDSLSCLHALEHFGLGRYGDPIDPTGHITALANLARILQPGGWLYLSVPIGPQRIEFNAHRVFALDHLLTLVAPLFELRALSYVDDRGDLHENVALDDVGKADSFGCRYGCGILELTRRGLRVPTSSLPLAVDA